MFLFNLTSFPLPPPYFLFNIILKPFWSPYMKLEIRPGLERFFNVFGPCPDEYRDSPLKEEAAASAAAAAAAGYGDDDFPPSLNGIARGKKGLKSGLTGRVGGYSVLPGVDETALNVDELDHAVTGGVSVVCDSFCLTRCSNIKIKI
jgi:hypothetical protein